MRIKHLNLFWIAAFSILVIYSCTGRLKRDRGNKFYPILIDKGWADITPTPLGNTAINFSDTILYFRKFTTELDTIKARELKRNPILASKPGFQPSYVLPVLKFDSNGCINYDLAVKGMGLCGNGLMTLNDGIWGLDSNEIILDVKGHYSMDGDFHYKIEYQISFSDSNNMQLRLKRVLESKFTKSH